MQKVERPSRPIELGPPCRPPTTVSSSPESFTTLTQKALPKLFEERKPGDTLRLWIPGCSSGEEPYSVAMVLLEFLAEKADEVPVQIFATDVSDTAIETARTGLYPESTVRPISAERLRKFFTQVDGKYRVSKKVREMCIFARHDLTRDPPFSKLDMVICRNVLIYLDQALQKRLFTAFHYALKPNGYLMLGAAETVGLQRDLFTVIDKKHRLYSKRPVYLEPLDLAFAEGRQPDRPSIPATAKPAREHPVRKNVQQEVNQLMLSKYAPPGVLVNDRFEIIQFRGQTGFFLEPAPGEVNLHVLKMVRSGLLHDLQQALIEARDSQAAVRKEGLHVRLNGHGRDVVLEVTPIMVPDEPPHYLILFEDVSRHAGSAPVPPPLPPAEGLIGESEVEHFRRELDHTRRELETTRRYLQSAIQDLEITNEELQSANEEVLSSNEELQSTNEELDTAKEELQSTNEELNTLNAELHSRNDELSRLNSDLINLLSSVQLAVIMVDRGLCIRRFTPPAEKLFNLIAADVGRPMQHIKPNIVSPNLEQTIHDVIEHVTPLEQEVQDVNGRWYLLRVRPYCSVDNRIEGAVIALVDIDAMKRREMQSEEARREVLAILQAIHEGLVVLDDKFCVQMINDAFCRMFAVDPHKATGKPLFDVADGAWKVPPVRSLLESALKSDTLPEDVELEHEFPGVGRKRLILSARRVESRDGHPPLALLAIREV
ncbi:MAG TPA: CheR family methyltransferase [Pirellulales bacterium]|nr:CheR family methyltransferase [Pirellulales bacterium]